MTDAATNLRTNQRQLDADGCEVGVSRQAIEEVLTELEQLRELRMEANIPVAYFHRHEDGGGETFAVYGTSSISYVELLRLRLAAHTLKDKIHTWVRDVLPLAGKMNLRPDHIDKLIEAIRKP